MYQPPSQSSQHSKLPKIHAPHTISSQSPPSEYNAWGSLKGPTQQMNEMTQKLLHDLHEQQQRELEALLMRQHQQQQQLLEQLIALQQKPLKKQAPQPKQPSQTAYKPYTLNQYKMLLAQPLTTGGLGPRVPDDQWKEIKERQNKMLEFAEQVKQINHTKLSTIGQSQMQGQSQQRALVRDQSRRQKGLEFAKKIPKPPQRKPSSHENDVLTNDLHSIDFLRTIKEDEAREQNNASSMLRHYEERNAYYKNQLYGA